MELKINELAIPAPIKWNYYELGDYIKSKSDAYKSLVYTDDQIGEAKRDRAALRKAADTLKKERISVQKKYMEPFEEFKAQVDDLVGMIDDAVASIDSQVKEYENQKAKEKAEAIEALIAEKAFPEGYNLAPLRNPKWMNATYSLKKISEELDHKKQMITADIDQIERFCCTEFKFEVHEFYKKTLDLRAAVEEEHRLIELKKRKEEAELRRKQAEDERIRQANLKALDDANKAEAPAPVEYAVEEPVEVPAREWVTFSAYVTVEEAKALAAWLRERGISIRA